MEYERHYTSAQGRVSIITIMPLVSHLTREQRIELTWLFHTAVQAQAQEGIRRASYLRTLGVHAHRCGLDLPREYESPDHFIDALVHCVGRDRFWGWRALTTA